MTDSAADFQQPAWLHDRLEWFMDLRFGLILHWGPYAQWDCCESWPLVPDALWARTDDMSCWTGRGKDLARFSRDYRALNRTFNPVKFDPDAWANIAVEAGFRYVTFTTKHHDGFCMFDTATTDYRITHPDCPYHRNPKANVAREVFNAFRRKGLAASCYFSKSDWNSPYYWSPDSPPVNCSPNYNTRENPGRWNKFVSFAHRQVEELMSGYGPFDVLWLDGGQVRPPDQDIRMADLAAMARRHQPGLIIADRTVGGPYENIVTPEQEIPDKPLGVPWESCMTLGNRWKYWSSDVFKPASKVIEMLIETTAKGGNLLLGVGPGPDGSFPTEAVSRLREIGAWLRINGEGIFGSRARPPYASGPVRFTRRGSYAYAFLLPEAWKNAADGEIEIRGLRPQAGSEVRLLKTGAPVAWRALDDGFAVRLAAAVTAGQPAIALRMVPA